MKQLNLFKRYYALSLTLLLTFALHAQMHVQVTPECDLEITNGRYIIYFHLPNYTLEDVERGDCGEYSSISIPNSEYDMTDEQGYPLLPFYPIHLILPDDVNNVQFSVAAMTTDEEHLSYPLESALMGLGYGIEDCYNEHYYQNGYDSDYPTGFYKDFYTISPVYTQLDSKGVTLSIYPFAYSPEDDRMEVLQEAVFYIDFTEGDIFTTIETVRTRVDITSGLIMSFFDTFAQMEHNPTIVSNGNYLILAAHQYMEYYVTQYANYKRNQYYNTEVLYLDAEGVVGDAHAIASLIENNSIMPNPDYVLLIGSLEDIPPLGSNSESFPYNDDYYHRIVGRWILSGEENDPPYTTLWNIIHKTVLSEYEYNYTNSTAELFSGIDITNSTLSDDLYEDLESLNTIYFTPSFVSSNLHDGRNYNSQVDAQDAMTTALQSNPRFFIYSGHGQLDSWTNSIAHPYMFDQTMISLIGNSDPFPIGFGFACKLNTYVTNNSFGARWVAEPSGGVAFYGATTNTYLSDNSSLMRKIFHAIRYPLLYNEHAMKLGNWLFVAEQRYLCARMGLTRLHQIQKYNLIGDPTLAVFGMYPDGAMSHFHKSGMHNDSSAQNLIEENREVIAIDVFDIHGNKMCSLKEMSNVNKLDLESGIYLLRKTYNDGSWSVNKFIK